ncbi:hypothetical protein [Hellea balneolensis]|uniref:hypothetical protein n=1 Tax=Hellea balneolensis TaxID=287478 RepID=UPI000425D4EE|nr:hypothetical protein [Hellea balneolensis]
MMMQDPNDNLFKDVLANYTAPVPEDGFTQNLMAQIEVKSKRQERIRRVSIYGASFAGGLIAASQFPALLNMIAKIQVAIPSWPQAEALPFSVWSIAGLVLLSFVLWAAFDRKASDIF